MPDQLPISFRHARALARSLAALGLEHVVISPGSRSTPLVLTFHEIESISKLVVLDERVAAFTALGISRASGFPAALLCTSGTAAANYYPAVIEAKQSGIPLLVLTADRSNLDRKNGAPQSMVQPGMFGNYIVFDYDVALPDTIESMERLEYLAWQAMDTAIHLGGPAHLNVPFDKPLEPSADQRKNTSTSPKLKRWLTRPKTLFVEPSDVPEAILSARRPVVIAGPMIGVGSDLGIWAKHLAGTYIPLIASHTSRLTITELSKERIPDYVRLLRSSEARKALKPDLIIRLGHFPVSKSVEMYLEDHYDVPEWSVLPAGLSGSPHNPSGIRTDGFPSQSLLNHWSDGMDPDWRQAWYSHRPDDHVFVEDVLTDGGVHQIILENISSGDAIFVSNSLPVRDLDTFGSSWNSDGHRIFSARGVSGIDGVTSQAVGTALGSKNNTVLITGDLAFLHDSNALMLNHEMGEHRLIIVVVNNNGGKIFKSLPIAAYEDIYDRYFGTPQSTDIGLLCRAHGLEHRRATTRDAVIAAFRELTAFKGISVLECVTDPGASQLERQR
jgi:2-succinyl-5-enolpyruvyl-6-hydroxy-3-cyclohexene-1-carboxylate synthase